VLGCRALGGVADASGDGISDVYDLDDLEEQQLNDDDDDAGDSDASLSPLAGRSPRHWQQQGGVSASSRLQQQRPPPEYPTPPAP
jgi:hypothetical protein